MGGGKEEKATVRISGEKDRKGAGQEYSDPKVAKSPANLDENFANYFLKN